MSSIKARLGKFDTVDEFVNGYGQYFFRGGILLPTRRARDEGEHVSLHIQIASGETVLRGEGVVQQVRKNVDGGTVGMVIRFKRLDRRSKDIVDRIMDSRRELRASGQHSVPAAARGGRLRDNTTGQNLAVEDLGAIAEAIETSFDSIFTGSFQAVGNGNNAAAEFEASLGDLAATARVVSDDEASLEAPVATAFDDVPPTEVGGIRPSVEDDAADGDVRSGADVELASMLRGPAASETGPDTETVESLPASLPAPASEARPADPAPPVAEPAASEDSADAIITQEAQRQADEDDEDDEAFDLQRLADEGAASAADSTPPRDDDDVDSSAEAFLASLAGQDAPAPGSALGDEASSVPFGSTIMGAPGLELGGDTVAARPAMPLTEERPALFSALAEEADDNEPDGVGFRDEDSLPPTKIVGPGDLAAQAILGLGRDGEDDAPPVAEESEPEPETPQASAPEQASHTMFGMPAIDLASAASAGAETTSEDDDEDVPSEDDLDYEDDFAGLADEEHAPRPANESQPIARVALEKAPVHKTAEVKRQPEPVELDQPQEAEEGEAVHQFIKSLTGKMPAIGAPPRPEAPPTPDPPAAPPLEPTPAVAPMGVSEIPSPFGSSEAPDPAPAPFDDVPAPAPFSEDPAPAPFGAPPSSFGSGDGFAASVESAAASSQEGEAALDDLLADAPTEAPLPAPMTGAMTAVAPSEPAPKGFFGKLVAWLKGLFGG